MELADGDPGKTAGNNQTSPTRPDKEWGYGSVLGRAWYSAVVSISVILKQKNKQGIALIANSITVINISPTAF